MNYATATRAEIRELVRINAEEMLEFSLAGGNVHQKSLDQKDLLEEQLAPLTDEQRERFYGIYAEEMEARTQQTLGDARKNNEQALMIDEGYSGFGRVILIACVVVAVIAAVSKFAT